MDFYRGQKFLFGRCIDGIKIMRLRKLIEEMIIMKSKIEVLKGEIREERKGMKKGREEEGK